MAGRKRPARTSHGWSAHTEDCTCIRCVGFPTGNKLAVGAGRPENHGAYSQSLVKLGPVVDERAEAIRDVLPVFHPADQIAIRALAIVLIRIERAESALERLETELEEAGRDPLAMFGGDQLTLNGRGVRVNGLRDDLAKWLRTAERYLSALGMTPASRARLGLDLMRSRRLTVLDLHRDGDENDVLPAVETEA